MESYLAMYNKSFRVAITRIRLSSHVFMIERARWNVRVPELRERVCIYCNVVESEYHCLIECPRFTNERLGCLPFDILWNCNLDKFYDFLNCTDLEIQNKLGLLCFRIQKKYQEDLFQQWFLSAQ